MTVIRVLSYSDTVEDSSLQRSSSTVVCEDGLVNTDDGSTWRQQQLSAKRSSKRTNLAPIIMIKFNFEPCNKLNVDGRGQDKPRKAHARITSPPLGHSNLFHESILIFANLIHKCKLVGVV